MCQAASGKLGPPGLIVVQSHSETVYPRPICQPSDISESACPKCPQYLPKFPEGQSFELYPTPLPLVREQSDITSYEVVGRSGPVSYILPYGPSGGMNSKAGNSGSGDNGNGNDVGIGGGKCSDDGGGGSGGEGI
ncbi:hypothetical protein Tco_1235954 [Tanacetum coccineum]